MQLSQLTSLFLLQHLYEQQYFAYRCADEQQARLSIFIADYFTPLLLSFSILFFRARDIIRKAPTTPSRRFSPLRQASQQFLRQAWM